jgi:hypothetical protein
MLGTGLGVPDLVLQQRVDEEMELRPEPLVLGQERSVWTRLRHAEEYGRFHEAESVEDWSVVGEGACTYFRTGSFAAGNGEGFGH